MFCAGPQENDKVEHQPSTTPTAPADSITPKAVADGNEWFIGVHGIAFTPVAHASLEGDLPESKPRIAKRARSRCVSVTKTRFREKSRCAQAAKKQVIAPVKAIKAKAWGAYSNRGETRAKKTPAVTRVAA